MDVSISPSEPDLLLDVDPSRTVAKLNAFGLRELGPKGGDKSRLRREGRRVASPVLLILLLSFAAVAASTGTNGVVSMPIKWGSSVESKTAPSSLGKIVS